MPAYAQRSPSEALSPSVGPQWDRPTAISSDVWLHPKLHRPTRPPQSGSEQIAPITALGGGAVRGGDSDKQDTAPSAPWSMESAQG
ncbi:hypothetical protein ACWC09_05450 [Streptomyces sp. NPDC001617]